MEGAFRDRRTLRGIARTLLALALLAERAAGRAFPVRFLVLSILWRAEAVARAFVAGATGADGPDVPCFAEPPAMHYGAADAEVLALRLRMLAAVLGVLSGADGRSAGRPDSRASGPGGAPGRFVPYPTLLLLFPARRRPRPHDTS